MAGDRALTRLCATPPAVAGRQEELHLPEEAHALLRELGAPERLLTHARLVGEAAEALIVRLGALRVPLDVRLVRFGAALHDAGKVLHPAELGGAGGRHELDGEQLLLAHGVDPAIARCCRSHARWTEMDCTLEELVVALADKLWKGARVAPLEERVIDQVADQLGVGRWDVFVALDTAFEEIAAGGAERLARSR